MRKHTYTLQNGFLDKTTKGYFKHDLKYDSKEGRFEFSGQSWVRMKCDMDFTVYPFDIQSCPFIIIPSRNMTYQEGFDLFLISHNNAHHNCCKFFRILLPLKLVLLTSLTGESLIYPWTAAWVTPTLIQIQMRPSLKVVSM